jgi:hypothetical protein
MKKVLVFVHGAGKQLSSYADNTLAEIALILGWEPLAVPVYYADICNLGSPVSIAALDTEPPPAQPEPPSVTQFKTAFMMQVQSDVNAQAPAQRVLTAEAVTAGAPAAPMLSPQFLTELLATEVNEIARYLFEPETYNKIQARMCDGLAQAAQQGDTLVIASHSLGTVVAFDALRAVGDRYHVSTFFTLGCPLAKLRQLGNRNADLGAITHDHVGEWQNWYETTDPISNALGPWFPLPGYRLRDVFVNIAPLLPASHDYFGNREVLNAIAGAMK